MQHGLCACKGPNDNPSNGASQQTHCTRCDSAADLAISLLLTLLSAASFYAADLQLCEAAHSVSTYII